jgi:DNA-binding MarR family transcriptional regulator
LASSRQNRARSDLTFETWAALLGAAWPIFTAIADNTVEAGVTSAQISLLVVLSSEGGNITPTAVARSLEVTPGTVTGTLNHLEKAGLIKRSHNAPEDRRIVNLQITPRGRDLVKRWQESCRTLFNSQMESLTDQELRTVINLLARIGPPIKGVPPRLPSILRSRAK